MKIRIFDAAERDFTGYGLGPLPDAVSALVTEERNGAFDLEMEYPLNGIGFDKLEPGRILFCKARPGDTTGEPFRIYKTEKRLVGTVTVWAHHISYDLNSEVFLGELNTVKTGIVAACNALNSDRAANTSMIRIWYDGINTSDPVQYDVGTIQMMSEALAGGEGSLLSAFGGELKYQYDPVLHREDVILCATRGNQIMQGIRYGFKRDLTRAPGVRKGKSRCLNVLFGIKEGGIFRLGKTKRQRQKQLLREDSAVLLHSLQKLLKENPLVRGVLIDEKHTISVLNQKIGVKNLAGIAPGLFLDDGFSRHCGNRGGLWLNVNCLRRRFPDL